MAGHTAPRSRGAKPRPRLAALYAGLDELRRDTELWPTLWGPMAAVAARHMGDPAARTLLDEAIAAGFNQIEPIEEELVGAFGGDPDWAELVRRIRANHAPVPLVFTDWPTINPTLPLTLFRIEPEREPELRQRIPAPSGSAWATALELLSWVSRRWRHANSHLDVDDAVKCLDRVDAGDRFACVEYSLVLSQALNAVGIPARKLALRQAEYQTGMGRGHVVSEAWIDDLGRWVVLDGQNGSYWAAAGRPLGVLDLQALTPAELAEVEFVPAPGVPALPADAVVLWRTYFHSVTTTGITWSPRRLRAGHAVAVPVNHAATAPHRRGGLPGPVRNRDRHRDRRRTMRDPALHRAPVRHRLPHRHRRFAHARRSTVDPRHVARFAHRRAGHAHPVRHHLREGPPLHGHLTAPFRSRPAPPRPAPPRPAPPRPPRPARSPGSAEILGPFGGHGRMILPRSTGSVSPR